MEDRFKVRAWYNRLQEYDYNIQNVVMADSKERFITFFRYVERGNTDVILEQCTCLKDKNGKLIYEGDIVEVPVLYNGIPTGQKQRCKAYYKHGAFNIYAVESKYLEIIGNIHENPELLEGK